jgi:hypothetical protein
VWKAELLSGRNVGFSFDSVGQGHLKGSVACSSQEREGLIEVQRSVLIIYFPLVILKASSFQACHWLVSKN